MVIGTSRSINASKRSPRSQAAAEAAGALANGDKDGTGEGEGGSAAMEVSEDGVDAAGHDDGDGNDDSEGDGKDDGNGKGDGVGPATKPAVLPSRPSFVAAFAVDTDSSLLPVSVGHCRDGLNAPPPYMPAHLPAPQQLLPGSQRRGRPASNRRSTRTTSSPRYRRHGSARTKCSSPSSSSG